MTWDRESLTSAFRGDDEADAACQSALLGGASYRAPRDELTEAASLASTYERRARHLADRGIHTIGFERGVERLRLVTGAVRLGSVHSDEFNFVFFLAPDDPVVLSCMGVAASVANPDWGSQDSAD